MKRFHIVCIVTLLFSVQSYASNSLYASEKVGVKFSNIDAEAISQNTLVFHNDITRYSISNLFDNKPDTAWVTKFIELSDSENLSDEEINLFENGSLRIVFKKPVYLDEISIQNGYQKNDAIFHENERVKNIRIEKVLVGGRSYPLDEEYTLKDSKGVQTISLTKNWPALTNLFKTKELIITVEGVYPGSKYHDLCISDISLKFSPATNYTPKRSWEQLSSLILKNRIKNTRGWDWPELSGDNYLMADLLYYTVNGNSESYDLFKTYYPYSTIGSELMSNVYEPAVKASLGK